MWAAGGSGPAGVEATITGTVNLVWGDGNLPDPSARGPFAILTDASGARLELILDGAARRAVGGILTLDHRLVEVHGTLAAASSGLAPTAVQVASVRVLDAPVLPAAVTGSQPWVSIMCKFSDIANEPKTLAYFQGMYASTFPGLDHYWKEVSYNYVNVVGSNAYGWFTLPQPRSYYIGTSANLNALFDDCTAVADPYVYFAPFVGINLMFNSDLDGYAWGGSRYATLDGVTKSWRTTWEPPWGYDNVSVLSHEMGHGFGLPHSNWNGGGTYDNSWDVMSNSWAGSGSDPTYHHYAQHTISYHKDILGWLRAPEKLTVAVGGSTSVRLERLGYPGFPNSKMVTVPIAGSASHFYTVEARQQRAYDVQLPGNATVIHEVDTSRGEPAWVMGTDGASGAAWTPGELFRDATSGIGVVVASASSSNSGYVVSVANGPSLAASFPAVDAHAATGTSSNLNGVLEPGETVQLETSWANVTTSAIGGVAGTSTGFTGPVGATYAVPDAAASYGTINSTATSSCLSQADCYNLQVSNPTSRPATHWDATFSESVTGGIARSWTIHIGSSFTDAGPGSFGYANVEALLHSGITAGCTATQFCPGGAVNRWQMAVFLAKGLAGSDGAIPLSGTVPGVGSYNCTAGGTSLFSDVPPTDTGCKHVHYVASRGITSGCAAGQYCPSSAVTRWEMAVFLAKAMTGSGELPVSGTIAGLGSFNCTSGGSTVFSDVPPTDAACRHVHFIAAQGVTAGCSSGLYCPTSALSRAQMAVFLGKAFVLQLYAP